MVALGDGSDHRDVEAVDPVQSLHGVHVGRPSDPPLCAGAGPNVREVVVADDEHDLVVLSHTTGGEVAAQEDGVQVADGNSVPSRRSDVARMAPVVSPSTTRRDPRTPVREAR